jgi:hypothetical protein
MRIFRTGPLILLFLILLPPSGIFIKNPPVRAEVLLKNPFFFGLAVVMCLFLQIWISYLSALYVLEGDLILGLSLFLVVPALGVLMVSYFLWVRRQRLQKPSK